MATAILQFRRGTTIPTLTDSEPFWDNVNNKLVIGTSITGSSFITLASMEILNSGSMRLTGNISASNAFFTGSVRITGDLNLGGSIILGDEIVDQITVNGVLSGSLVPATGSMFNIGNPSSKWNTIYAESAIITNFTSSYVDFSNVDNKPTLVSGSSQIDHNTTSNYTASRHSDHATINITAGNGLSGGGTITQTRTVTLDTGSTHFISGIKSTLDSETVISGSSQLTSSYDTRYTLSGSVQPLPSGIVSGSSQISYPDISNIPSGILSGSKTDITSLNNFTSSMTTRVDGISSQTGSYLTDLPNGTVSGSSQVSFSGISGKPTLVSGSGQISYTGITGKPSLVSGSSQLTGSYDIRYALSGSGVSLPSGLVSGSSQLTSSYDARYTLSGSVQPLPNGLISGSSQLTGSYDLRYSLSGSTIHEELIRGNVESTSISGSKVIDLSSYSVFKYTLSANTAITDTNLPDSGSSLVRLLILTGSYVPTFPTTWTRLLGTYDGTRTNVITVAYTNVSGSIEADAVMVQTPGSGQVPSGLVSGSSQLTSSYDTRYALSGSGVTLPSGLVSGSSQISFIGITDKPTLVSGSSQLTSSYDTRYTLDSNFQSISSSFDTRIIGIASSGSGADWNVNLSNIPTGLVSGSSQINFNSISSKPTLISGSSQVSYTGLSNIPSGILSGSKTDITSLNNFTSSITTRVDGISSQTGSYLTSLPTGTVSGSSQVNYTQLSNIPSGILSGSHTDITSLNNFTSSMTTRVDGLSAKTGSYLTTLPTGTVSGSSQVSFSGITGKPSGLVSGSSQVSYTGLTNIPSGILSGSKTDITSLNNFTSSITTRVDGLSAKTGSYLTTLPTGTVSGSSQVSFSGISGKPALVSGSAQISFTGITGRPTGLVSGSSQVSFTTISGKPSGLVSGSSQVSFSGITGKPDLVSGSSQLTGSYDTRYALSGSIVGSVTVNNTNNSGFVSDQVFNPDGTAVSTDTDDYTLSSTNPVANVFLDGIRLRNNEYSLTGTTLTVTPINGFSATDQEVIVQQYSFNYTSTGAVIKKWVQKSANYTITVSDYGIEVTSGTNTQLLPSAVGIGGQSFCIKNMGSGTVTVDGDGLQTIDGATTKSLTQYKMIEVTSNGSDWMITQSN